jgi:4-guanidinobutyraldehyde dehydrogenase/NAD-dependent aldehyde dehydrogenase
MTTLTRADWEQRARDLKIEGRAFINGEYTDAASGETFECISPVDGRLWPRSPAATPPTPARVENARATFNSGVWSRLAPAKRKAT